MAKHTTLLPLLALLIACGGAPEAASPADATEASATPAAAEPGCADLDQTKCKITAGCAWASDDSGCAVDKVNAFAP